MKRYRKKNIWFCWWIGLVVLFLLVCIGDLLCSTITFPVSVEIGNTQLVLHAGSSTVALQKLAQPVAVRFVPVDPVVHEYQIDGSDSTNNFSLDPTYLHQIAQTPYYQFQSWMRDLDGESRWANVQVWQGQRLLHSVQDPMQGVQIALPTPTNVRISMTLQRPETPRSFDLLLADQSTLHITLDRNDRYLQVLRIVDGQSTELSRTFFPADSLPFAAMILSFALDALLWAMLLLLFVFLGSVVLAALRYASGSRRAQSGGGSRQAQSGGGSRQARPLRNLRPLWRLRLRWGLGLHPVAYVCLVGSFVFVCWVARVQYSGEPHIYDAVAYLFAAKIYAQGHLSVPVPSGLGDLFPGPFMLQYGGRWFAQYPPGTALTLVPGVWLGAPWLIEPLCGTLALLGIGLVTMRLYHRHAQRRRIATLAVVLGTLSPFYSYLAASYLSHAIALFYLVWGLWFLLGCVQETRRALWNLLPMVFCFGMAAITRDLVGLLYVVLFVCGIGLLYWRRIVIEKIWRIGYVPGMLALALALCFVMGYLSFNMHLTGNPFLSPRTLFFPADRLGFGQGIGFYGQHTLAAGLVNLDELLTILAIDLYGWPFYLTFGFWLVPFLTRRAKLADWLLLGCALVVTLSFVAYFYHGIYLGPRYLFELLPCLLILTARGILLLAQWGKLLERALLRLWSLSYGGWRKISGLRLHGGMTTVVLLLLLACNLIYYMPRQIARYQNYSGLPQGENIDLTALYHPNLHNAIVVTSNLSLYQLELFPLNDPLLHGDIIYAYASDPSQYTRLSSAFPGRTLYLCDVQLDGSVRYEPANLSLLDRSRERLQ